MNATLKQWAVGAVNAAISGAAVALGSFVAGTTFKQGAIMVGISAGVSLAKWIPQHPIPGGEQ